MALFENWLDSGNDSLLQAASSTTRRPRKRPAAALLQPDNDGDDDDGDKFAAAAKKKAKPNKTDDDLPGKDRVSPTDVAYAEVGKLSRLLGAVLARELAQLTHLKSTKRSRAILSELKLSHSAGEDHRVRLNQIIAVGSH